MDELNDIRQQMAAMKQSLDRSQIVSRKLMAKVMKNKASLLNRIVLWECVTFPFIFFIILGVCLVTDSTIWIAWVFLILGGADTLLDFRTIRISTQKMNSYSLLELRKFIIKQKYMRRIQTAVAAALMIPWLLWAYYEWFHLDKFFCQFDKDFCMALIGVLIFSVIVAFIVVLVIMKKIDGINDEMVADIDEYGE